MIKKMQNSPRPRSLTVLVVAVAILFCQSLFAKSKIDGDWEGTLENGKYVMVFHIRVGANCTVDSVTQMIRGMPANVEFDGSDKRVRIDMPGGGAVFEGFLKGPQIVGAFMQAGTKSPMTLTKRKKS